METMFEDAEKLFKRVGAWDTYGKSGWGPDGDLRIFEAKAGGAGRGHATGARSKLQRYMTPALEKEVDEFYAKDYTIPNLNLERLEVFADASPVELTS